MALNREISNSDDIIDSRDVIARIEELEPIVSDGREAAGAQWDADESARGDLTREEFMDEYVAINLADESGELKALRELAEEAEGYAPDWQYGAQLIRDSYFVTAMQELCEDIGDMPRGLPAYLVIDWEATARNLQVDYTSVEFDGVTYWVR